MMELNVSEHYHKVLSHLIISGSDVIDSIADSLCSARAFKDGDLQRVREEESTKGKVEIVLRAVISQGCEGTFLRCLEDNVPEITKSLMSQISNESGGVLRPELAGETDRSQLLQNLEVVSCERDLINEEFKNMSNKYDKVTEQLAQAQAESVDLLRKNASDQQELAMLRRKSLIGGGGNPIINKMYENMLERYEELKSTHEMLQQKLSDESNMRNDVQLQLDAYAVKLTDTQRRTSVIVGDNEVLSRKLQNLNEKNEALQRDLHRVRDERTLVKREYALVMSERDAVHREIEKLHEDINDVNRQLSESINEKKLILDEKERLMLQLNTLKQNQGTQQSTSASNLLAIREELFVAQRERKQALAQYEEQLHEAYTARKSQESAKESLLKLQTENEALNSKIEALSSELRDANNEAKDATRNRDMAFKEREKMRCERDEIKKTYDQLAEERERIMKQLEAEIKEHDVTKEMKKRLAKELRELQPHRGSRVSAVPNSGSRDNTDSHDSAIDAGEWGSEEISTLMGGGVQRRLRTFSYKLPRQPNITLETGLFVIQSNCRGIAISDRVVSINDTTVDSNNASQLQRLIPNSVNTCIVKVVRSSSPPPNESQSSHDHNNISLNGDYGPLSVDSAVYTARLNTINKPSLTTADAECQTSQILRTQRNKHRKTALNNVENANHDVIAPMVQRGVHHNSPSMAGVSSGGESHQSISTYSDSTQHSKTSQIPRQSSQKSSDSSVSVQRSSSSKREKKKSKMASSRFWSKMKKSKSLSGPPNNSSGGTWPRLESPPLVGAGRLSVFTAKKKNRPLLSPTTFTPPMDSAGRTPPTVIRGQPVTPTSSDLPVTPRSFTEPTHPGAPPSAPSAMRHLRTFNFTKKGPKPPRPVSVPIDVSEQPLTLWTMHNVSNNNNSSSQQQRPQEPKTATLPEDLIDLTSSQSGTVASEPLLSDRSSISHDNTSILTNQSERLRRPTDMTPDSRSTMTTAQPIMTVEPMKRPHTIFLEKTVVPPNFLRQHSVPLNSSSDRMMTLPESLSPRQQQRQGQRSKVVTSPIVAANLQPRTAHSLPRPSSAKTPSSRASSHQSVDTHKTKSLDYKRIRIPSEASVVVKISGSEKGSINLSSDRSTPISFHRPYSPATPLLHSPATPLLHHQMGTHFLHTPTTPLDTTVPSIPGSTVSSLSNISATSARGRRPPVTTDPRYVCMVKGTDPIGISIVGGGDKAGIFVSRITEDSLAARAGLEYGDQLLEYNGINLRSAFEAQARAIMSQTQPGDNITFLAQYNLEKYKSSIESNLSDSLGFLKSRKPNPALTPCEDNEGTITPEMTPRSSLQAEESLREQPVNNTRYIFLDGKCNNITLVGGNRSGIFVASFAEETLDQPAGLKVGDQILEYNSIDLRKATLERASLLLARPAPNAALSVVYNNIGFSKLSMEPGDFFYVRTLFDNIVETGSGNLSFSRNSILLIDDTYPDNTKGTWSAWQVDEQGEKTTHGKIPSKFMVERESGLQREFDDSVSYAGSTAGKKLGGTGRRSFFKRRKPHRTSSRSSGDVKLHKSVSETSIESTETSFEHIGAAYQVVEKHVSEHRRPVVIFGPHSGSICDRLQREYGSHFAKCTFDALHSNSDIRDKNVIDTFKQVTCTMALRVDTIKREIQQHRHVLLEISQDAVDRLHSHRIYPIMIFVDYSSAKKIKESQDRYPGREKITMKQSKELFERANSVRKKLSVKYLGTVYIHGGSTAAVAKQIHTVVEHEQSKVLWLPAQHDLLNY